MNPTELWSSGPSSLGSGNVPCKTTTHHDVNTTVTASQVIVASGTGLFYFVMFTLSILGVWDKPCAKLCSSQRTLFVFLIGPLVAFINVFANSDNLEVKLYFRTSTVLIIGTAFTLFGATLFFSLPGEETNEPTLGRHQPSMGCIVGTITFPLFLIEAVLLSLACKKADKPSGETVINWILVTVDKSAFLIQKPIQMGIYLYLRNTIACSRYRANAQFYFRIMSFFNLNQWVDSQVNMDRDIQLNGDILKDLTGWFNVLVVLYKALIIDYRLLCCLLFLEHSREIPTEDHEVLETGGNEGPTISCMTTRDELKRCSGFIGGCLCLTAPVICSLYYLHSLQIGGSVQIFAIIVNSVILVVGTCFLRGNDLDEGETKESPGVKTMVCGIIYSLSSVIVRVSALDGRSETAGGSKP